MQNTLNVTRRSFLKVTGPAVAAFTIIPGEVLPAGGQTPPSEKLNIACIGVGGQGAGDVSAVANGNNIVALCDPDQSRAESSAKKFPGAQQFQDFRKMFDTLEKSIDAVTVSTPDHTHAVAVMAAIKRRKHVYCQKPLAHSVFEVRQLMKAAKDFNVVTQLGNQGHSSDSIRQCCEMIWDGAIGNVHTIHAGCSATNSGLDSLPKLQERPPVPPTLNWDLWIGPAQMRPYHPAYCPGRWRGWTPFGNGTIGDWTCHVIDPVFWALDLGVPATIQAQVKDYDPKTQGDVFPKGDLITFEFPAKGKRGPIKLIWHSGAEKIPRPKELAPEEKLDTGAFVFGDKGIMAYGSHGASHVRLLPEARNDAYQRPEKKLPRVKGHHGDWLNAIRTGTKAGSDFSYGGPLTEIAMLGVIALKYPGLKLQWDAGNMRFVNFPDANRHLNPPYRAGWSL